MPYLVDGNNVCGAGRDRRLGLPTDELEMIRTLADFSARRSAMLTVVFDGPPAPRRGAGPAQRIGRVKVVYSGAGRSADDAIVDLAEQFATPKDITVVTSDRELRSRVRWLGCRVIGCRQFAGMLQKNVTTTDPEEKPVPGDIEEWEKYFAGDE